MDNTKRQAILLLSCKDQKGLVFKITNFIFQIAGNIIDLDEHVDTIENKFFFRVAFEFDIVVLSLEDLTEKFNPLGEEFNANWNIHLHNKKQKVVIFVSKYEHCLQEILWRTTLEEFNIEIVAIISNHKDASQLAQQYNIPFHYFNITKANKIETEQKQIELLNKLGAETIVLARYMQILSPDFVKEFPNKIINIHHSFLPAFIGGNPYKQAYLRGVKIIGATSHYVTDDLDEGQIIEQDIIRISHSDTLKDLIRKGRDLERLVLARGLLLHSQYRILVDGKKTIVF
ncbi:MAG: formyltetrahydrofolate deformylase [Melioribacteraceae bacterium]